MKSTKSILPLLALLLATSGCREKGTFRIIEAVSTYEDFFSDSCPDVQAARTLSFGRLDVSNLTNRNTGYTALLRLQTQDNIAATDAKTSYYRDPIIIKEVETYFTDEAGADIGSLPTASAPNIFPTGGILAPAKLSSTETVITAPLMRASDVVSASSLVQGGNKLKVLANIKVWAELQSGYPVDSFVFTFPIEICRGCLFEIGLQKDINGLATTPPACVDGALEYKENEGVLNGCSFSNQDGPQFYCQ